MSKETDPVGQEPGEPLLAPEPLAPPDAEPEVVAPLEAEPDAALPLLPEPDEADEPEEPPPSVPITKKLDEHPVATASASETANTKDKSRMAQYPLIRGVPPCRSDTHGSPDGGASPGSRGPDARVGRGPGEDAEDAEDAELAEGVGWLRSANDVGWEGS